MSAVAIIGPGPLENSQARLNAGAPGIADKGLVRDTFKALGPYINLGHCGRWYGNSPKCFNPKGATGRRYLAGCLKQRDLQKAMKGEKYYYASSRNGRALLYIDVDAKNGELDQRQLTFAILDRFEPRFFAASPDGRIYLKVNYGSSGTIRANRVMKAFCRALREWAVGKGFQAVVDDAKGTISTRETRGTLGRLPVTAGWNRAFLDVFLDTPEVTLEWLEERTKELRAETPKASRSRSLDIGTFRSVSGLPISNEEIEQIPDMVKHYRLVAGFAFGLVREHPRGRRMLVEDFQIALAVINITALHPNPDKQNPTKRIEAIWRSLYHRGLVSRSFCCHRWKAIRDTLADLGFLDCIDCRYWFQPGRRDGTAMKWELASVYQVPFSALRGPQCAPSPPSEALSALGGAYLGSPESGMPVAWRPKRVWRGEYPELARQAARLLPKGVPKPGNETTLGNDSGLNDDRAPQWLPPMVAVVHGAVEGGPVAEGPRQGWHHQADLPGPHRPSLGIPSDLNLGTSQRQQRFRAPMVGLESESHDFRLVAQRRQRAQRGQRLQTSSGRSGTSVPSERSVLSGVSEPLALLVVWASGRSGSPGPSGPLALLAPLVPLGDKPGGKPALHRPTIRGTRPIPFRGWRLKSGTAARANASKASARPANKRVRALMVELAWRRIGVRCKEKP